MSVDPISEARARVEAARNNLLAVRAGQLGTEAIASAVVLLDQAAEWLRRPGEAA